MSDSVTPPALGYAQSTLALRPPRVAIVFPAPTEAWTFYARIALHQANHIWGGSGFVLVPHTDGKVSVSVLDAVAAYDPDYVVAATFTFNERLAGEPGFLSTVDGPDAWTPEHKAQFLERAGDEQAPDLASNSARDTVALACEVYGAATRPSRTKPRRASLVTAQRGRLATWARSGPGGGRRQTSHACS